MGVELQQQLRAADKNTRSVASDMRYAVNQNGVVVVVFVEWSQILISFKTEFKVLCAMVDASTLMIPCLETQMKAKVHHYGEKCNVNKFHQTLPNVNVCIPSNLVQIHGTTARCEWGNCTKRWRAHSSTPTLRRNAATAGWLWSMANLRGVMTDPQKEARGLRQTGPMVVI
jgi:hypothetical protein